MTDHLPLAMRWVPEPEPRRVQVQRIGRLRGAPRVGMLLGCNMLGDGVLSYLVRFDGHDVVKVSPAELVEIPAAWTENVIPFPTRRATVAVPMQPGAA